MKYSIKGLFIKCDQIHSFLRIWSHLLKKSLIENFIFCAVSPLQSTEIQPNEHSMRKQFRNKITPLFHIIPNVFL